MVGDEGEARGDGASQQAIEHHYDIGRDFYQLWLGTRMVYSCALWPGDADDDLDAAQLAKLAWHATSARVDNQQRVLDVGCGWGALVRYLVEERDVGHVTGLTLSSDQATSLSPSDRWVVRLEDWRDHDPDQSYDAVISIGAFEHFSRPELSREQRRAVYRGFFGKCSGWLAPGKRLSLQTIAWEDFDPDQGSVAPFISQEIFPESTLPQLSDIVEASEARFRLLSLRNDGGQYSATLRLWQRRLESQMERACELVGKPNYRRYLRYLRVSRAMFDRQVCTLYRITFERRP